MTKENFFHKKSVVATFAILAIFGGIFFMQQGTQNTTTGNIVLSDYQEFPYNFISLIGMTLILCAVVLVVYVIKKK